MSDYHHAKKMTICPKCGGKDKSSGKFKFSCENCTLVFP